MKAITLSILLFFLSTTLFAYSNIEKVRQLRACPGCNLRGVTFSHYDLTGVDLSGANLQFARFRGATLYNTNLSGANLRGADFSGARWTDGVTDCAEGSIGGCNKAEAAK